MRLSTRGTGAQSAKPYIYINETEIYGQFKSRFGDKLRDPERAVYPACGADATPLRIFSKILYLDHDPEPLRLLRGRGGLAVEGGLELLRRRSADCVIARRPPYYIIPEILSIVARSGFLLTPFGYNPTNNSMRALEDMPAAERARLFPLQNFVFVELLFSRGTAKTCTKHEPEFSKSPYGEELVWGVWRRTN